MLEQTMCPRSLLQEEGYRKISLYHHHQDQSDYRAFTVFHAVLGGGGVCGVCAGASFRGAFGRMGSVVLRTSRGDVDLSHGLDSVDAAAGPAGPQGARDIFFPGLDLSGQPAAIGRAVVSRCGLAAGRRPELRDGVDQVVCDLV